MYLPPLRHHVWREELGIPPIIIELLPKLNASSHTETKSKVGTNADWSRLRDGYTILGLRYTILRRCKWVPAGIAVLDRSGEMRTNQLVHLFPSCREDCEGGYSRVTLQYHSKGAGEELRVFGYDEHIRTIKARGRHRGNILRTSAIFLRYNSRCIRSNWIYQGPELKPGVNGRNRCSAIAARSSGTQVTNVTGLWHAYAMAKNTLQATTHACGMYWQHVPTAAENPRQLH